MNHVPSFPVLARVGLAIVAAGLLLDLSLLVLMPPTHHVGSGAGADTHGGHLVVLIGMVLILLGVIADGARAPGRRSRPEGSSRNAIR
jgi:hypothetical protein